MVFLYYLKKWGGRIRRLNSLGQELCDYCRQMNVFIVLHFVPSALNPADVWSCQQVTLTEASLDPSSMATIWKTFSWIDMAIDWMASAVNKQCQLFFFRVP